MCDDCEQERRDRLARKLQDIGYYDPHSDNLDRSDLDAAYHNYTRDQSSLAEPRNGAGQVYRNGRWEFDHEE